MQNVTRVIKRPELTTVGNRQVSACGWRHVLAEDHLDWHLSQRSQKWCSVGCMSKTLFQRDIKANRAAVRKRVAPLFNKLLERGLFLVIEYDATPSGHGKIKACKLFEKTDRAELEYAQSQVTRMLKHRQLKEEMYQRAMDAIGVVAS